MDFPHQRATKNLVNNAFRKMNILPLTTLTALLLASTLHAQNPPWKNPLKLALSTDGITFNLPETFQDSAGVPSVVRWKGDTLACAFQWFRAPINSPTWDRVAIKFSYDNGQTWTSPKPVTFSNLPPNYQRPFDPTLLPTPNGNLLLYCSSSMGIPNMGLDATINTYRSISQDGLTFDFSTTPIVDEPTKPLIDPALIHFNGTYHYSAPIGSPGQGAYHYVSPDAINFSKVPNIPSDNAHNWTGNFVVNNPVELRFYGSGSKIWFNSSPNGGVWTGFTETNIHGGDPSVVKLSDSAFLMIYVGLPYPSQTQSPNLQSLIAVHPNPATTRLYLKTTEQPAYPAPVKIYSSTGILLLDIKITSPEIDIQSLPSGNYFLQIGLREKMGSTPFTKL
jgi:hypothetical protein